MLTLGKAQAIIGDMSEHAFSTVLFDLDGTLLPMDRDRFMQAYLSAFAQKCKKLELPVERSIHALDLGFTAMLENDGTISNERRFWKVFGETLDIEVEHHIESFLRFYTEEFTQLKSIVKTNSLSRRIVDTIRKKGYRTVLATTPVFPRAGTIERMAWAGLDPSSFDLITTYEDFSYAKPHLGYYREILHRLGVSPQQCLMVGNDVQEDLIVQNLGMEVYLVTDHLIHRDTSDTSGIRKGSLEDLMRFCEELPRRQV